MGLLDDAIREHLELKRRRGADAGDISRQESDALGPVRRLPGGKVDLPDTFEVEQPAEEASAPSTPWQDEQTSVHEPPAPEPVWEDEQTAVHEPAPLRPTYQPPPARDFTPFGSSPPEPPAQTYEPPSAPSYEPPSYQPPPAPSYPAAAESPAEPETGGWMEAPPGSPTDSKSWMNPPPPAPLPDAEPDPDSWMRPQPALAPDPPPPIEIEIEPEPASAPAPEHGSLISRFRLGRRGKDAGPRHAVSDEPRSEPPPAGTQGYVPPAPPAGSETRFPESSYADTPPSEPPQPLAGDALADDVLEETPDFLEETPEHDRLWFEQRPPRDFDFDG